MRAMPSFHRDPQGRARSPTGARNAATSRQAPSSEQMRRRADGPASPPRPRRRRRSAPARTAAGPAAQQHAAAAQAERERRADAPIRLSTGVPSSSDRRAGPRSPRRQVELQPDQRRDSDQRQAGDEPVRDDLGAAPGRARAAAATSSICSSVPSAWSAANRRGSDSIAASSAATQTTPGRDRAQQLRLGADAERKQADRDDEEGDGSSASARRRRARRRSRRDDRRRSAAQRRSRSRSRRGAGARARRSSGGWLVSTTLPPRRACSPSSVQRLDRRRVERGERLVEQPRRCRAAPGAPARRAGAGPATGGAPARRRPPRRSARARRARPASVAAVQHAGKRRFSAPVRSSFTAVAWPR